MSAASPHSAHLSNEPTTSCDAPSLPGSTSYQHVSSLSDEERKRDNNSSYPPEARSPAEQNSLHFDGIQNAESKSGGQGNQKNSADNEDKSRDPPQAMLSDVLNRLDRMEGTLFGLKKARFAPQGYADNYEQKYEPDELYEETGPNARIWRVYMDETATFDRDMIEEMRDALDVLLVFAALFSAIITTFVAQTSQQLSPDYTQMTAFLIYESIQTQKALANGTMLSSIYHSPLTPGTPFTPDPLTVWVNGLWFLSLTLSLVAALAAVLVKQWLRQYMTLPSGTVRDRACTRHFRYIGFQTWQVAGIVGSLPVLVHLSVGIFLAGIILFLIPLHRTIAIVIAAISGPSLLFYIAVNIIPVFLPSCPYRTPISDFVYWIYCHLVTTYFPILDFLRNLWRKVIFHLQLKVYDHPQLPPNLKMGEKGVVRLKQHSEDGLLAQAIFWLYDMSSNPTVHITVKQAVGGLPDESRLVTRKLTTLNWGFSYTLAKEIEALAVEPTRIDKSRMERLLRAWCFCVFPFEFLGAFDIPRIQNMFEKHENGYAISLLLPLKFHSNEQRLSMIEELMTDNIVGRCTHTLTDTMWNLLLDELKFSLKINHSMAFPFVRKIFSFQKPVWELQPGFTLAQYLCLNPAHSHGKSLLSLPEPGNLAEFSVKSDNSFGNVNSEFTLTYWLLLCYYERLNGHAAGNYHGVDLHSERDCLSEFAELADHWMLQPYHLEPFDVCAFGPSGDRIVTPWEHYESFLEAALSSSQFWDINPSCEPALLESICTRKAEIKATFSKSLNAIKRIPPLSPSFIARPEAFSELSDIVHNF